MHDEQPWISYSRISNHVWSVEEIATLLAWCEKPVAPLGRFAYHGTETITM